MFLTGSEIGKVTELRFLRIMSERMPYTPDWYVRTKRAKPVWDDRGIDFFVYIRPKDGGKLIKVPVQVKSGTMGVEKFMRTQSSVRQRNILLIVAGPRMTDESIRKYVYNLLLFIHESGKRFTEFYESQIKEPLPDRVMERRRLAVSAAINEEDQVT